jgi:hypothetical protein
VPRWSRSLLACPLRAGALSAALVLAGAHGCGGEAHAQQLSDTESALLAPALDGNPRNPPRFRATQNNREKVDNTLFGQLPSLGPAPASGAGTTGFDSTNGGRRKSKSGSKSSGSKSGGQPQSKTRSSEPSKPAGAIDGGLKMRGNVDAKEVAKPDLTQGAGTTPATAPSPKLLQPAVAPLLNQLRNQSRPGAPPAAPDAETVTVATTPPFWRPLPDLKPFDPLGVQVGAFNFRPAIEYSRGYDTNPARLGLPPISGSWFNLYAPALLVNSNWERHELTANLQGTYWSYDTAHNLDRPTADGRINGRIDVTRLSRIDLEGRFILGTDNPGSPNIQADLAHFPIFTTLGGSAGFTQRFNRFELTLKGGVDRTEFQPSVFVNGLTESNDDRNYDQYSTALRASYELSPALKPFAEVSGNERLHDLAVDRFALDRNSTGYSAKVGADVDLARTLTGQLAVGYLNQMYVAPLPNLGGLLVEGSLVWSASALTTGKLFASTIAAESPLFLTSGVLTRQVGIEFNHAFRRWLIGTAKFSVARDIYAGSGRVDDRYVASAALAYLLTRELALKGEYRQEWERSNVPGSNYVASVWLVGLRLQR